MRGDEEGGRPASGELVTTDAAAIVEQVASRIRQEALIPERESAVRFYSGRARNRTSAGPGRSLHAPAEPNPEGRLPADLAEIALRLEALQASLNADVINGIPRIGGCPSTAPTLRGRFGAAAVRILQRLLWWYTRSLQSFTDSLADQFQAELEALKSMVCAQAETRKELAALREEMNQLKAKLSASSGGGR
jgi:hypothetical protein